MRYNIILPGIGARHCRAPTGVSHVNENRYIIVEYQNPETQTREILAVGRLEAEFAIVVCELLRRLLAL